MAVCSDHPDDAYRQTKRAIPSEDSAIRLVQKRFPGIDDVKRMEHGFEESMCIRDPESFDFLRRFAGG